MRGARVLAAFALASALAASTTFCGGATFEIAAGDDGGSGGSSGGGSGSGSGGGSGGSSGGSGGHHDSGGNGGGDDGPSLLDGPTSLDGTGPDAGGFSCATAPTGTIFCADFDSVASVKDGWTTPIAFPSGATNTFDTQSFQSPPHGYAAQTPLATGAAAAALQKTFTSASRSIDVGFSFFVSQLDTGAAPKVTVTIGRLIIGQLEKQLIADVVLASDGVHLVQTAGGALPDGGDATEDRIAHAPFPNGTWVHVRLAIDRQSERVTLTFDDGTILTRTAIAQALNDMDDELDVGIVFAQPPSSGDTISYDNVLLRGLP